MSTLPLMSLGLFVFGLSSAPFDTLKRATAQRWEARNRVGGAPAHQYLGPGEDTRLGQDHDAIATIKDGHLLSIPAGHPLTLGGRILGAARIVRAQTDRHDFTVADRGAYAGVRAKWRHLFSAATLYAVAGDETGSVKTLKRDYPTEAEALSAARAELARLRRGQQEIRLSLARGRPEIIANRPLVLSSWRPEIDALRWLAGEVVHTIAEGGFVTEVTAQALED